MVIWNFSLTVNMCAPLLTRFYTTIFYLNIFSTLSSYKFLHRKNQLPIRKLFIFHGSCYQPALFVLLLKHRILAAICCGLSALYITINNGQVHPVTSSAAGVKKVNGGVAD